MSLSGGPPAHFPESMTWEEYEQLPDELARNIELWEGRVIWMHRPTPGHQDAAVRVRNALERCARAEKERNPERCRRVSTECNVFLGPLGKQDFLTPDFLVYRCLDSRAQEIRAADVEIAGEVLSPANTPSLMEAKKARYAAAGIPWYWEVELSPDAGEIVAVRSYGLTVDAELPAGVHPLYPANYLLAQEWIAKDVIGLDGGQPFPFEIPWTELEL